MLNFINFILLYLIDIRSVWSSGNAEPPYFYNKDTQQYEVLQGQTISIDRTNRVMGYFVQHFSEYALGGDLINGQLQQYEVNSAENWELFE